MHSVKNIQKVNLNGKSSKIFEVWEENEGANVFCGKFSASSKVANKNLLDQIEL